MMSRQSEEGPEGGGERQERNGVVYDPLRPDRTQGSPKGSPSERQGRELLYPLRCRGGAVPHGVTGRPLAKSVANKEIHVSRLWEPVTHLVPGPSRKTCPTLLAISAGDLERVTIYFWTSRFSFLLTEA